MGCGGNDNGFGVGRWPCIGDGAEQFARVFMQADAACLRAIPEFGARLIHRQPILHEHADGLMDVAELGQPVDARGLGSAAVLRKVAVQDGIAVEVEDPPGVIGEFDERIGRAAVEDHGAGGG